MRPFGHGPIQFSLVWLLILYYQNYYHDILSNYSMKNWTNFIIGEEKKGWYGNCVNIVVFIYEWTTKPKKLNSHPHKLDCK